MILSNDRCKLVFNCPVIDSIDRCEPEVVRVCTPVQEQECQEVPGSSCRTVQRRKCQQVEVSQAGGLSMDLSELRDGSSFNIFSSL